MAFAREDNLVSYSAPVVRREDIRFAVHRYRVPEGGKVLLPGIPEAHLLRMWPYLHRQSEYLTFAFLGVYLCALAGPTGEDVRRVSIQYAGPLSCLCMNSESLNSTLV